MILQHALKKAVDAGKIQLQPQQVKRASKVLGHVEHAGGFTVGVEFIFHPSMWWLVGTTLVALALRLALQVED